MSTEVVYAVPVRDNGKRTTFYTEVLPFVPGHGVTVLGEPTKFVPCDAPPQLTPELVWMRLLEVLCIDNGCHFTVSTADFMEVRGDLQQMIDQGYFLCDVMDLEGDYWILVAGTPEEVNRRFPLRWSVVSVVLDRIFERKD